MTPAIRISMGPAEWAMLILLSVIWGGSFYFYAVAVKELPVFTIVLLRVGIGALAIWFIVFAMRLPLPRRAGVWWSFLAMGALNNVLPFSLILWGQKEIASGLAAVLNGTTPFFTVLAAAAFTRDERLSWNKLAGALAGLGGVAAIIGIDAVGTLGAAAAAQLAVIGAALAYAFGSVFGRRFAGLPPIITAAGQTGGSTLLLVPIVALIDRPWTLDNPAPNVWASVLGLALLCTSLAYVLYFTVLKRAGATNLVLVTFLVPVSAILLGILFLGETLQTKHLFGMAGIGIGLALIDGRVLRVVTRTA